MSNQNQQNQPNHLGGTQALVLFIAVVVLLITGIWFAQELSFDALVNLLLAIAMAFGVLVYRNRRSIVVLMIAIGIIAFGGVNLILSRRLPESAISSESMFATQQAVIQNTLATQFALRDNAQNKATADAIAQQVAQLEKTQQSINATQEGLSAQRTVEAVNLSTPDPTVLPATFDPRTQDTERVCGSAIVVNQDVDTGRIVEGLQIRSGPNTKEESRVIDAIPIGGIVEVYCGSPPLTDEPWSIRGFVRIRYNGIEGYSARRFLRDNP